MPALRPKKKPVVLHPHAIELIEEMREIASTLRQLQMQLSEPDVTNKKQISLVCQHILTSSLLPKIMKRSFDEQGFNIRVKTGTKNQCFMSLAKKEVQFTLTYEEADEKNFLDELSSEQILLGHETYIPIAKIKSNPSLHEKIENRTIPIINYPVDIYLGEVQKRKVFAKVSPDIRLQKIAESGLVFAMAEYIKQGLGVGWLPKSLVIDELSNGELVSLEGILPKWKLNIKLSRIIGMEDELAKNFWDVIKHDFEIDPETN